MKILLTSDTYAPAVNGVVTSLCTLHRVLAVQGHSVRVLTLAPTVHTVRQGDVLALGSLDAGRIYPGVRLRRPVCGEALRELTDWAPDVVHSQSEFSTFPLARRIARAAGAPLLHTYHTVYEEYTHYFSPSRRCGQMVVRAFTRRVAAQTDGLIAPTPKVRALLESYGVQAPVTVLPTGVALDIFARPQPAAALAALRAQLGIPAGNRVLINVGRLAKEKNQCELLDARAALGDVPVTLLLVGDGPERPALQQYAAARGLVPGQVVFAGMQPRAQVAACYRLGDVFVSASGSETQGLTYLEAMASGLPLVCRADACLAGVLQDGVNGWQYRDARALPALLARLLDDPARCRALGAAGAQLAGRYSDAAFGQGAAALYRAAILQKRQAAVPAGQGVLQWRRA